MCGRCFEVTVGWHFHTAHKWPRIFPFEDQPSSLSLGKTTAVSYWSIHHHRLKYAMSDDDATPAEVGAEKRNADLMNQPVRRCWDIPQLDQLVALPEKVTIRPVWFKFEGILWQSITTAPGGPRRAQLQKAAPVLKDTCQSENKRKPLLVKLFWGASNYL